MNMITIKIKYGTGETVEFPTQEEALEDLADRDPAYAMDSIIIETDEQGNETEWECVWTPTLQRID